MTETYTIVTMTDRAKIAAIILTDPTISLVTIHRPSGAIEYTEWPTQPKDYERVKAA